MLEAVPFQLKHDLACAVDENASTPGVRVGGILRELLGHASTEMERLLLLYSRRGRSASLTTVEPARFMVGLWQVRQGATKAVTPIFQISVSLSQSQGVVAQGKRPMLFSLMLDV